MKDERLLTTIEIDTIGEIQNISMGAAATAVSVLLNRQVSITTPVVRVVKKDEFEYSNLEPVVGVEINYIDGLHGSNLMIMNITDVKALVTSLLGGDEDPDGELELDEIHTSALGEIMNQMMGSASTALATFFGKTVNISPPAIVDPIEFFERFFSTEKNESIVSVSFRFVVDGLVDNEFVTVLPLSFTKELVGNAMNMNGSAQEDEEDPAEYADVITGHKQIPDITIENNFPREGAARSGSAPAREAARRPEKAAAEKPARPVRNVSVKNVEFDSFDDAPVDRGSAAKSNIDLVMDVELNITVEIGAAKKPVREVLDLTKGSIIELNRQAGDPVDIIVNGRLFARGDVVVVDDNFGVRITEVIGTR